uniref:Chromatin remodeling complex ATPase n=1 Tax=Siphoviridae sp. ctTPJ4 TaxID=2825519 RepID=A0A8S5V066_9CAUD|nr:MAG TPA: Chromatin remodeling complex ATPase [Siphoviridae sp. ctTPJ4]
MYGLTHYTTVDSWNNISNYSNIRDSFIIFDEQRAIGNGKWAKTFVKMARNNEWIMLSGTPGDNWLDYCPVFIANGFFKNRTQFEREHCQFNYRAGYPRLERYLGQGKLLRLRNRILVDMPFVKKTIKRRQDVPVPYEEKPYRTIQKYRFDPYKEEPIKNAGGLCHVLRRVTNEDPVRLEAVRGLCEVHPRVIVFYNFDYELFMLRSLRDILGVPVAEYNGHKHEPLPEGPRWVYLVQYTAGAEAWNCTTCDTMIFFSQNYSWKVMEQCEGRIDRLNTPYSVLNYYCLKSQSPIDQAISRAIRVKEIFNERGFYDSLK